ncbi:MAG: hypothetical protein V3V52_05370 [Candidatus Adiutricales bacterium]
MADEAVKSLRNLFLASLPIVLVWLISWPSAEIDADVLVTLQKTVEELRGAGLDIDEEAQKGFFSV